jgi:tetratricopeptide (TPR) repeat protein
VAEAIAADEQALAIQLMLMNVRQHLGYLYEQTGCFHKAEAAYRQVVEQTPEQVDAWYNLGILAERRTDRPGARRAYEATVQARPDFWEAHFGLWVSAEMDNQLDAAIHAFQMVQGLGNASQPFQSWENAESAPDTKAPLEVVEGPVPFRPLPVQHPTGDETARHLRQWCPLGAGLTAGQPEVSLAPTAHCRNVGPDAIQAAPLRGGQGQARGRVGLGAVSDDQALQTARQPAARRPIRRAPGRPERRVFCRRPPTSQPSSRMRFHPAVAGYQASKRTYAGRQRRR